MAKEDDLDQILPMKMRAKEELAVTVDAQKPIQLQRRRVWRACESCRRKKIKCDGCEPTCSQCSTSGSQCTWLQTKDRAALSRHYVQELEARLLHMESLFTQIAPVIEHMDPSSITSSPQMSQVAPSDSTDKSTLSSVALRSIAPKERNLDINLVAEDDDDEVSKSFGQLALDEYGHMRWIGGSSTMSLIQSFRALTPSPLHKVLPMEEDPLSPGPSVNKLYFPAAVFFGKVHALPDPEDVEYPERDLADKLVEAYFSRFHFLMPVIDKPAFLRQYKDVMDNKHDGSVARNETGFLSLIFSVFACASNLLQDIRLSTSERKDDGGMGMVYYERALMLQYISHANTQISHVQCFILLSSFLCSVNCLPQAWILVGQAVRYGQDLGLHRSPRRLSISPIERETRRKIWWGIYSLDRMLALALGRPLGINDLDCDVELPVEVDDDLLEEYFTEVTMTQKQPSLMTGIVFLIRLYEIGGRVLRQVYALENCKDHLEPEHKAELQRIVELIDDELTKWCDDLPTIFKSQSETDEQVSMGAVLCSHYYSVLTTLHRNMLPVKRDQPFTATSTVKAVSAARSCIRLAPSMKHVVPPSHHLAFFIQHLFSSTVIILLYAMHSPDPRAASTALDEARGTLSALESWEGQWPGARKCKELLLELTTTATEAIAQAAKDKSNSPSATGASQSRNAERRRSVTLAALPTGNLAGGRMIKPRLRRNQSRDPGTSTRRLAAVSPYRLDNVQRTRSLSRRRGHEDVDGIERAGGAVSFYQSFSSPTSARAASSPHSSPASVSLPSPSSTVLEHPSESSPQLTVNTNNYNFQNTISPSQTSTSSHFEYDYPMQSSSSNQATMQTWNGNSNNRTGVDIYSSPSVDASLYSGSYGSLSMDGGYCGYESISDMSAAMATLSTTPPSASFAAPGLPFRGLDFIRNFHPGGYSAGEQDSLWQSYDPGAFGYDPDLPFTLGDVATDLTHELIH